VSLNFKKTPSLLDEVSVVVMEPKKIQTRRNWCGKRVPSEDLLTRCCKNAGQLITRERAAGVNVTSSSWVQVKRASVIVYSGQGTIRPGSRQLLSWTVFPLRLRSTGSRKKSFEFINPDEQRKQLMY